ncbi:Transketolase [Lobulomyces angularis]|nr:Transketolase [Lobulomyces angularis]
MLEIDTIRTLAADMVQKANSGHAGMPMGCAPMAFVLFTNFIKQNPKNPRWVDRDRFVLSNGHGCALQYIIFHLLGYKITMDDLKNFRQVDSITPGHPEAKHGIEGIELTTGPLGQGISSSVGIALAEAHMAATFNREGFKIIDNYTYCICGDGCLQEGISSEASSLAGHLKLGKLIVLYDDNSITIDGDTALGFTEDVLKRYEAYGWHVSKIDDGDHDLEAIKNKIEEARSIKDKPSIIKIKTTIGFGSMHQGEEKVHGSPLGDDDIKELKKKFGLDPEKKFHIPNSVYEFFHKISARGDQSEANWNKLFENYKLKYPELAAELIRRIEGRLPDNFESFFPTFTPDDPAQATRKYSETVLNNIADHLPELIGGSADLTGSNLTKWKTAKEFQADSTGLGSYDGRCIRFGVREHGMAAICNGIASYGGLIPFAATFFNFISYALGAVRLSALSRFRVLYIMTHDSIGLGEDGPTHQPVETLAGLRALPNILNFRPADGNEVSGSYLEALKHQHKPSVLILSRQGVPNLKGTDLAKVRLGAYIIVDSLAGKKLDLIIIGTGSEVSVAVEAGKLLSEKHKLLVRVVSMPCWELFEEQSQEYKEFIFSKDVPVLSVEALSALGWERYAHGSVSMKTFGSSGPYKKLFTKFGFDADQVAKKALKLIEFFKDKKPDWKVCRFEE